MHHTTITRGALKNESCLSLRSPRLCASLSLSKSPINQSERLISRLIRLASHARAEQSRPSPSVSTRDAVLPLHPPASSPMLPNPRQIPAVGKRKHPTLSSFENWHGKGGTRCGERVKFWVRFGKAPSGLFRGEWLHCYWNRCLHTDKLPKKQLTVKASSA
jgi:hypothetical protein